MKDLMINGLIFVCIVVFAVLLGLSMFAPVVEKPMDKTGWFDEVCIDEVTYLYKASRLSVKLGTDSKVILCDSE